MMELEMAQEYKSMWIRIAGNSKRIKGKDSPPHWRYEIEGDDQQHPIVGWTLSGMGTLHNNTQGTNPQAQGDEFLAWVKYYGNIVVDDDGIGRITLLPVPGRDN